MDFVFVTIRGMRTVICLAFFSACVSSVSAAGLWRVTALDPQTVVLQGDYSGQETESFALTPQEKKLTGWKFDAAVRKAVVRAQEHRATTEEKLSAGPYAAASVEVADFGYWKYPVGLSRYADDKGRLQAGGAADVIYIVYLKLAKPLAPATSVTWQLPTGEKVGWTYDPERVPTPLIKVNQVGYAPEQERKYAYLGLWLGPKFGAYEPKDGLVFEVVDEKSGQVIKQGPVVFRVPDRDYEKGGKFTGEKTLEMDFSDVKAVGRYFIRVPGIGRSLPFAIDDSAVAEAFATHMKGLFHQRCGCAKTPDLTAWTDQACHLDVLRGVHPSNEGDYGRCFVNEVGKPTKTSNFQVISANTRKLTEHLSLPGGWHDAADFDRRPMHLRIVNDLASLFLLRTGNFTDGQLAIPERDNGIPDILDEAEWGLRHLLAAQQPDGGVGTWIETNRHPGPADHAKASADRLAYCLSRASRGSSLEYAAHAALLARAFLKVSTSEAKAIAEKYQKSALAAWQFSRKPCPGPVPIASGWKPKDEVLLLYQEPEELDPNEEVKAAVNLYALTGDVTYLDVLDDVFKRFVQNSNKNGWAMSPVRHAEFAFTESKRLTYGKMQDFWLKRIVSEADEMLAAQEGPDAWAYRNPYHTYKDWRVSHMPWGASHALRRANTLCMAHALTGERKYLEAAFLANDFHNGCNPNGSTWTSGLGVVYPVRYLSLQSYADGIAEYVPGITPYRTTFGLPPDVKKWVWNNKSEQMRWPYWRQYANIEEHSVGVSEFTVWETISPAAFTCGYLMKPGCKVPFVKRTPARDVRDLPGFWAMP